MVDTTGAAAKTAGTPVDSAGAPGDSLPPALPPPPLVALPAPADTGFSAGAWAWARADLMRSGATTLTDLLSRVPGITGLRNGYYGAPETVSAWGSGGRRMEVVLDGFALDPLGRAATDLARFPLANLESVRVERGLNGVRIELHTLQPLAAQPYSVVEAQAGEPLGLTVFRGVYLAPHFLVGPFSAGVERTASDGLDRAEPANVFSAWVKWSLVNERRGVQVEYLRSATERGGESPFGSNLDRSDLVIRGRTSLPGDHAVLEAFAGQSVAEDSLAGDAGRPRVRSRQMGARLGVETGPVVASGEVRYRTQVRLPRLEGALHVAASPLAGARLSGEAVWDQWRDAGAASAFTGRAELGPFLGLTPFAEVSAGKRGVAIFGTAPERVTPLLSGHGARVGASFAWKGTRIAGAALDLHTDSVYTFGVPFDSVARSFPGGDTRGWELSGHIPILWRDFFLEGGYVHWMSGDRWLYLPEEEGRVSLVLHTLPLGSGNLEILGRLEADRRGVMSVPSTGGQEVVSLPARTVLNAYLQIRIVTVRAFVRFDNMSAVRSLADLPGRTLPAARVVYGVKWELWN